MSASVNIEQWTGSSGSPTKTSISSGATITSGTSDSTSPPAIPQDGTITGGSTRQSYITFTRLNAATAPLALINNVIWWCSTTLPSDWTGNSNITCFTNNTSTYLQATGTPNVSGNSIGAVYGIGSSSIFAFTSSSPMAVSGSVLSTASFPNDTWSNGVMYFFSVPPKWLNAVTQSGITPGTKTAVTFNWQYDEI